MRTARIALVLSLVVAATLGARGRAASPLADWSRAERETLFGLSLATLPPLAPDPSNHVADDARAAALGQRLFFDTRLSATGTVSCATCHQPALDFQDGRPTGRGVGTGGRRTMPVAGTAHGAWFFWDGRADSQWAQALGPLENPVEHGTTRTAVAHEVVARYAADYTAIFGPPPSLRGLPHDASPAGDATARAAWNRLPPVRQDDVSRIYANVGKAIAAYERRIRFGRSRVDAWIDAERAGVHAASALTDDEIAGARLFVGRARCATCHTGARLTDDAFHNTGVAVARAADGSMPPPDDGRRTGVRQAVAGEFACTGRYSDAAHDTTGAACGELRFADSTSAGLVRAYKTPSLRNVGRRAPYMHAGQLATLEDVVDHYSRAPRAPLGASELKPLGLSARERRQLVAFLRALDAAPVATPAALLVAPAP